MLVYSNHELETYQVLGTTLRVHWDSVQYEVTDELRGTTRLAWVAKEAVFKTDVDRQTFIAEIDALGGNGEELAAGWFNS